MAKKYEAANECVYCGSKESLSDEHLIPLALGGKDVLPRASCARHRDITSILERHVARGPYHQYRIIHDLPTRRRAHRKQQKENEVELEAVTFGDRHCTLKVPVGEVPLVYISLHPPLPQIITGVKPVKGAEGCTLRVNYDNEDMQRLLVKHHLKKVTVRADYMQAETLLRLLAKIAHAFAVAEYGLRTFTPTLLPIIEGTSDYPLTYIGAKTPEEPQSAIALESERIKIGNDEYLAAHISLHALPALPRYYVISGKL
jgi:hypothetical protein